MLDAFLLAFGTLLPIVNPVSTAFVFNALTEYDSTQRRNHLARISAMVAALVLLIFALVGHFILGFFGITIYAFRVAGGLYLAKVGFDMLSQRLRRDPENYDEASNDIAIMPLAIPLLAGPGSIAATLVLSDQLPGVNTAGILFAILAVCAISWISLRHAHAIDRVLGKTGTVVVQRLFGLIVLVIAVQFLFHGVTGYIATLG